MHNQKLTQTAQGSLLIIISAGFFGSYGIWSKVMSGAFGEFNQAWTRALILLFLLIPFGLVTKGFKKITKADLPWFIVISLSGALNQAPYYYGFQHLPVGTATLLFYVMLTVGAYVIGKFFFNETLSWIKLCSLGLAILGLLMIYRFALSPTQLLPALSTMLAGLMGANCVVLSKKISATYSETQILTTTFMAMLIANLLISASFHEVLPPLSLSSAWLAQGAYAITMLLANVSVIGGFKYLEPSIGGLLGLLEVVFAAFLGVILFGDVLTPNLIIGSVIVFVAAGLPDFIKLVQLYKNR